MTRAQIERAVSVWQAKLRLDHWDIKVEWDKPCDADSEAECVAENQYDIAKLRFNPRHTTWKVPFGTQTVIHELLHLHERDLERAVSSVRPLVGAPAYELFWSRYLHEREGVVDRLAWILYEVGK